MALTTAANRNSALHFLRTGITPIFPDNTIAQLDRQSSVHSYGGILATVPGTGVGLSSDQTIWFLFDDPDL
jgi:hypothetical protein